MRIHFTECLQPRGTQLNQREQGTECPGCTRAPGLSGLDPEIGIARLHMCFAQVCHSGSASALQLSFTSTHALDFICMTKAHKSRVLQAYQQQHRDALRAAVRNANISALDDDDPPPTAPVATSAAAAGDAAAPAARRKRRRDAAAADSDKPTEDGLRGQQHNNDEDDEGAALAARLDAARGPRRRQATPSEEEPEEDDTTRAERIEREKCARL